jgi:hypothetical protein
MPNSPPASRGVNSAILTRVAKHQPRAFVKSLDRREVKLAAPTLPSPAAVTWTAVMTLPGEGGQGGGGRRGIRASDAPFASVGAAGHRAMRPAHVGWAGTPLIESLCGLPRLVHARVRTPAPVT